MCNSNDCQHDSARTFFRIPKRNLAKLQSEIEKLSKRSQKAGGWEINLFVFGTLESTQTEPEGYEVFLEAPDVRLEGYTFVARLDHSQETGNIIRMIRSSEIELPAEYRTAAPKCDHCNMNRQRRDTFVLRNIADGSLIQMGSNCMAEIFKSDPRAIMKLAEIVGYAREAITASQDESYAYEGPMGMRDLRVIDLSDYLHFCAMAMRLEKNAVLFGNGFRASREDNPTKYVGLSLLAQHGYEMDKVITDEDRAQVARANEWVDKIIERRDSKVPLNQFEHNLLVVAESTVIEKRACGIAAALVGYADRALGELARKAAPPAVPTPVNIILDNMDGILGLFNSSKLRSPKITISFPETGEIVLAKAGATAQHPGTINVTSTGGFGNSTWYGRIHKDGRFERTRNHRVEMPNGFEKALAMFASDPASVAAAYGHRTGNCAFCNRKLTDERSARVGYGKICATNWNLVY